MPTQNPGETTYLKKHITTLERRKAYLENHKNGLQSFSQQELFALETAIRLMRRERERLFTEKEKLHAEETPESGMRELPSTEAEASPE